MSAAQKKTDFIDLLARFLVENQAGKSILLEMETKRGGSDPRPLLAKEWAALRQAAGLRGYLGQNEAVETLTDLLR